MGPDIKCAKIKDCRIVESKNPFMKGNTVLCVSEAGDKKFLSSNCELMFPAQTGEKWTCPKDNYVSIDYEPEFYIEDNIYHALRTYPADDCE